jgi:hypothetical protein
VLRICYARHRQKTMPLRPHHLAWSNPRLRRSEGTRKLASLVSHRTQTRQGRSTTPQEMTPVGPRITRDSSRTLGCNTLCIDTSRTKFVATIIWDRRTNLDLAHALEGSHRLRRSGPSGDYHRNELSTKQCDQHKDDRAPWDPTKMYASHAFRRNKQDEMECNEWNHKQLKKHKA